MSHQNLWAPWRMAYLRALMGETSGDLSPDDEPGNFLTAYWAQPERDDVHHVLYRDAHGMILLNRYPYANGHLLVALGDPRPTILDYEPEQRAVFWSLIERAMDLVQRALSPQGINMGINQGRAAGAGVPEHLHAHVVPRWSADTNFITVVGRIRVIPDALEATAAMYRRVLSDEE
jgi:ATP adenylyltransferase